MAPAPKHVVDTVTFVNKGIKSEKNIKITISNLDFYSGKPSDHGEIFIKPVPFSQMLQRMEDTRPWENPHGCPSILPIDDHLDNREKARAMWYAEEDPLFQLTMPGPWKVEDFIVREDPTTPHLNCFLSNEVPLKDMVPSTGELRTILWSVGSRILDKDYQCHRIVPVTIVSACGLRLRIVQGYVDQAQLIVRMTPIVDFTAGEKKNWNDFIQTICWMIGEPVGVTT
ncbi:hypothetical protein GGR53DRAFT_181846 [Hypoxylon sp. FL1150]|nr:hypothetical protein GGR53DRAFT_181846 [Hypoxylon sp. FL1150]